MERFNKPLLACAVLCLILAAGVGMDLYPRYVLSIRDQTNHKTVMEINARPGDNVWVVFINSVERLPVADHFVIDHLYRIVFTETIYQAPYAGYLLPERKELIAPGTLRIAGMDRVMDEVTFYAGYDFRHLLFVNGNWTPLYHVARGGDIIRITLNRKSLLATFFDRMLSDDQR